MYRYTSWWAEKEVTLDMARETSCFEYYNPQISEKEWEKIQNKFRNACKEVYQMTPEEFAKEFGDDESHTVYYSVLCLFGSYSQCEIQAYQDLPECQYYEEYDDDGYNYDQGECED